ncbi:MAG: hypothetical protein ACYCVD_03720 [Desulfitobacteriaceae bacterium]
MLGYVARVATQHDTVMEELAYVKQEFVMQKAPWTRSQKMPYAYYARYAYGAFVGLPDKVQPKPKYFRAQVGEFPNKADAVY